MANYDRKDVIPVVVMVIVAGLVAVFIAIWLDQTSRVYGVVQSLQCPFYENVDEEPCLPPPNLVCNEDFSFCSSKDEVAPISEIKTPYTASQAVENVLPVVNCTESK